MCNKLNFRLIQQEIVAFGNAFIGYTYPVGYRYSGMLNSLLGTGYRATINSDHPSCRAGGVKHKAFMGTDTRQTVHFPHVAYS
jgi:hypothetical protein